MKSLPIQLLHAFLQKFLTNCLCNCLDIWLLQPRFIACVYLFPHDFLVARFTHENAFLQFHFSPLGYVFFAHAILKINLWYALRQHQYLKFKQRLPYKYRGGLTTIFGMAIGSLHLTKTITSHTFFPIIFRGRIITQFCSRLFTCCTTPSKRSPLTPIPIDCK